MFARSKTTWLGIGALLLAIALCGCSGNSIAPLGPAPALQPGLAELQLPQTSRLTSAAGDEFLPLKNGADYADDLDYSLVAADSMALRFHPAWDPVGGNSLGDAAYCIYRLQLNAAQPATLSLAWNGDSPAQYWVALANRDSLAWDWFELGAANEIAITDPAPYSDGLWICYAAVVVLGGTEYLLDSIGFAGALAASPGYTLIAPLGDTDTYLIDMDGSVVHTWASSYSPGNAAYLTEDPHLLRAANVHNPKFTSGGTGGRIEKYDWDGNLVWSFDLSNSNRCMHHDFELLPGGNILVIAWIAYGQPAVVQAGRDPARIADGELWADAILEIEPAGLSGGNVVWEWYSFDHLVQDFDAAKSNYGDVAASPELIDINYSLGPGADWLHVNGVDYNAGLDQIVLSNHNFCELWVIDHSTTTAEAAGHAGGLYGRGGDLLYRWGNPRTYRAGAPTDQYLYGQHDVYWIPAGLDGAGNLLMFNNGMGRPGPGFSSVVEITTPVQPDGSYPLTGPAYGPVGPAWEYIAAPPASFFSNSISGAQRLSGGNTLICAGEPGWVFEVTGLGEIVWEFTNPYGNTLPGGNKSVFRAPRYEEDYSGLGTL